MGKLSLANSPYFSLAAESYALAASISESKWPSVFAPTYALQGLHLETPLNSELLFLLFLLFIVFWDTVQIRRFARRLSNPFPFTWSTIILEGGFIRNRCREIFFLLGLFPRLLAGYSPERCHLCPLANSKSASSINANLTMPYLLIKAIFFMQLSYLKMLHKANLHTVKFLAWIGG